ncbi:efflux RND transporter periplasmic adaptor subunit [Endothiovibrio diazotrophicus]
MTEGNTKRMIVMLVIAGAIMGGVVAYQGFKNRMIARSILAQADPPQTVSTTVARESSWQPTLEALGTFSASEQAALSAEVNGLVTAVHFDSGEEVSTGQPLVELNPEPLKAQLAELEVQVMLAELTLRRDQSQIKTQSISHSVVDTDTATLKGIQAQVRGQRARIAQKTIAAPFPGRLGIRQVNLGQYLAPGTTVVTLQRLDPMLVDFTVPQSQIGLIRIGMKAVAESSAAPGRTFEATVTAIEPQVDTATRNLMVRALVPNPDGALLPGVFTTVRITDGQPRQYITLPNAAVTYNPFGATVFIVKEAGREADGTPKGVAEQRFITTGLTRGDQVAVLQGVTVGETVVTAGQLKLHNGSPIRVNNQVQPSDNPNPPIPDP